MPSPVSYSSALFSWFLSVEAIDLASNPYRDLNSDEIINYWYSKRRCNLMNKLSSKIGSWRHTRCPTHRTVVVVLRLNKKKNKTPGPCNIFSFPPDLFGVLSNIRKNVMQRRYDRKMTWCPREVDQIYDKVQGQCF